MITKEDWEAYTEWHYTFFCKGESTHIMNRSIVGFYDWKFNTAI